MGSRGNSVAAIPDSSRKIVKSLKEIVGNCPEPEIYAMLKECNMDPNEAVSRLLSQDPFHEVKSKREKKKENKHTTESKPRGSNNYSSRGGRGGSDHYGGRSASQFSSSDSGTSHGKPGYKKENGSAVYGGHSYVSAGTTGSTVYRQPQAHSDPVTVENKATMADTVDGGWGPLPSSGFSQPSSGSQPVWGGAPGQVSMADIVKMGRPQSKPSSTGNHSKSNSTYNYVHSSKVSPDEEWPLAESSARISPVVQPASSWPTDTSRLSTNVVDQHQEPEYEDVPEVEDTPAENVANHDQYTSASSERIQNDCSEVASHFNNDVYENTESYQPHADTFEHQQVEEVGVSVSSVTSNLQQLKVVDEREVSYEEEDAAVIIPSHLQVQTEDCLHLSFGSFGSFGAGPASVPLSTRPTNSNTEEASADEDAPVGQLDSRNSEYYGEEALRTGSEGNLVHRSAPSGVSAYDLPSVSQSEVLHQENHERPHESQYDFPSSSYSFDNGPQLNAPYPPSQTSAQMQTYANAYGNTSQSTLLGASPQSAQEPDYSFVSPFGMGQSMPSKYGNNVSSVSSSSVSIPEVLKAAGITSTPQNLSGSNIATGPALPQHLIHQFSQMGPYANLIGYPPYVPPSYYMPGTAYQQAFAGNNAAAYHQSLGAVLPQYKNSVSVSSLPQSAAVASGYGGSFGSSSSLPGNFQTNQPSGPGAAAVGYEEILNSQYKDQSHLLSLQQTENPMWVQGPGSRTMQGLPANTYYNYQGQTQQQQQQQQQQQVPSGFRQTHQQLSQNYGGALGNSNYYHSQSGVLLDHHHQQMQNPRDGSQVQGGGNKQSQQQQLWQNNY